MNTVQSSTPITPVDRTQPIKPLDFQKVATGITTLPSKEPLVSTYSTEYVDVYHLCVHVYVPDGYTPYMSPDFGVVIYEQTGAGDISVRQLPVSCAASSGSSYSLWSLDTEFQVSKNNDSEAIRVYFDIGDPRTSRGTVTTVANS